MPGARVARGWCARSSPPVEPALDPGPVCAALVEQGIEVHARHGVSQEEFTADLLAVAESGAELVIDDGAELTRRMAEHRPELYAHSQGSARRRPPASRGCARSSTKAVFRFPAIAANDARCKHMFDNPYGTGQTTLTAILALTNVLAAGRSSASSVTAGSGKASRAPPTGSADASPSSSSIPCAR